MADPLLDQFVFDAWSPLSFKRVMGSKKQPGVSQIAPTWVGEHIRRLSAYRVLQSYVDNSARMFKATASEEEISDHREYGDANLLVQQIVASLLGEGQEIVVEGAEEYNPDATDNGTQQSASDDAEAEAAHELQEWLRDWWKTERGQLKLIETERNAVSMGDGVYSIGWSAEKERPRVRCWDPGFYFPVLHDGNEDDYPETVHIAWEIPPDPHETRPLGQTVIRRLTWRLGQIRPAVEGSFFRDTQPRAGDTLDPATGGITRTYAWNEKPSSVTCYYSDATWTIDSGKPQTVNDLTGAEAVYAVDSDGFEVRDVDLQIDFVPVVHVPNTVAIANHYGRSSIATVLQILDDLANADTDLQSASATTGKPPIALHGATLGKNRPTYRAGEVWEVGDGGMDVLDTSRSLDALLKYVDALLERTSVNSRVPSSVLGRVKPSEVPSGVALALSFGPLAGMVSEMRLVRDEKYPLLFKFAQRLAVAGGDPDVPTTFDAATRLELGSYLPQDRAGAVTEVQNLLSAPTGPAISRETAIRILVNAGFPIDDAREEVRRIEEQDFTGANDLLTATGDEDAVFAYLNREKPAEPVRPAAPEVVVPGGAVPAPGAPPVPAPNTPPALQ